MRFTGAVFNGSGRLLEQISGTFGFTGQVRESLTSSLGAGTYRLSPMQVAGRGADRKVMWGAQDAVVLKWVALQLSGVLPVHPACEHVKGHGGGQRSVQRMDSTLRNGGWKFVCRTDIRGFYAHIRRGPLFRQLRRFVFDARLLDLVWQYLNYTVERGGEFYTPKRGICRGCALSPLLGGFCLFAMDAWFSAQKDIRYVRYMDDFVLLSRTRWRLRRAIRALNMFLRGRGIPSIRRKPLSAECAVDLTGWGYNLMRQAGLEYPAVLLQITLNDAGGFMSAPVARALSGRGGGCLRTNDDGQYGEIVCSRPTMQKKKQLRQSQTCGELQRAS